MVRTILLAFVIVATLLASPELHAQRSDDHPSGLSEGSYSISFRLPESGIGSVGVWRMLSPRVNLGLTIDAGVRRFDVEADGQEQDRAHHYRLTVHPILKRYFRLSEHVAPFAFGGLFGNFTHTRSTDSATRAQVAGRTWHLGADAGAGVEWFVVPQVSLGGRIGFQSGISRTDEELQIETLENGFFFNTFTTNLILHVYF